MARRTPAQRLRRELRAEIAARIARLGITQTKAADLLGVTQPRVNDLLRGRVELFSLDALVTLAARLGLRVRIRVTRQRRSR